MEYLATVMKGLYLQTTQSLFGDGRINIVSNSRLPITNTQWKAGRQEAALTQYLIVWIVEIRIDRTVEQLK